MSELPFGELQDLALLIFYKSAKNDLRIPGRNTRRFRVYRMTGQKEFFVERAVDGLADKKLIEESKEAYSRPYITAKGIEYFERQLSRKGSTIEKYYGTSALKIYAEDVPSTNRVFPEITGRDVIFLEFIPASDRAVR